VLKNTWTSYARYGKLEQVTEQQHSAWWKCAVIPGLWHLNVRCGKVELSMLQRCRNNRFARFTDSLQHSAHVKRWKLLIIETFDVTTFKRSTLPEEITLLQCRIRLACWFTATWCRMWNFQLSVWRTSRMQNCGFRRFHTAHGLTATQCQDEMLENT